MKKKQSSISKDGKPKKWKVVRNPWWMKEPYHLEPCAN
jgi:hypothetical protein